jgi:hypothetical protein
MTPDNLHNIKLGTFERIRDYETNVPIKPINENIGTIEIGLTDDILDVYSKVENIPTSMYRSMFEGLPVTKERQKLDLIALELAPIAKAKGIESIEELSYHFARRVGWEKGLHELPWDAVLYYILERGSSDLNLHNTLLFVTEPIANPINHNKLSCLTVQRDNSHMNLSLLPLEGCPWALVRPDVRIVFSKNK